MSQVSSDVLSRSAVELCEDLRAGSVTPDGLLKALESRHAAVDGRLNALPTLCADRARSGASAALKASPLHGLPVVVKDLSAVAGVRTTYGSKLFRDHVPGHSDYVVERLEQSGGLPFAKSNTPEFGCGGVTFNDVLGETRNPWNPDYTPGGSSGGSAAALASGQAWLALGSDFGGSLRLPASFCGVVGLRPTPGCIPRGPSDLPFDRHWVEGPMARSVGDLALLLDALVGQDCRDPLSVPRASGFLQLLERPPTTIRIGDVGGMGMGPIESEVAMCVATALEQLAVQPGWSVEQQAMDLSPSREVFAVRRGLCYAAMFEVHRRDRPDMLRQDIVADLDRGLTFDAATIARADRLQGGLWNEVERVFRTCDIIACPTVAVAPFRAGQPGITHVAGEELPTYYDWLRQTYALSMVGIPSMSLPCGFTSEGLPIGLQLAAPPHKEALLLQVAAAVESALNVLDRVQPPWAR